MAAHRAAHVPGTTRHVRGGEGRVAPSHYIDASRVSRRARHARRAPCRCGSSAHAHGPHACVIYIYIYAAPCQRSATRRSHARQCSLGLGSWRLVDVSVLVWLALGFCAAFWFVILSPRFKRGCGCTAGRAAGPAGRFLAHLALAPPSRPPRAPEPPVRGRTRETQRPRRTPRAKAEPD